MKSIKLLFALLAFATQVEAAQLVAAMRAARTRMPMCHRVALHSHHAKKTVLQDTLTKEMIDLENTMRKTELFSKEYNILNLKYWNLRHKLDSEKRAQSLMEKGASDPDIIKFNNHVAKYAFFYRPIISFFAPSDLARLNEIVDNHKQRNK